MSALIVLPLDLQTPCSWSDPLLRRLTLLPAEVAVGLTRPDCWIVPAPLGPLGPVAPAGPVAPLGPCGPTGPRNPRGPRAPRRFFFLCLFFFFLAAAADGLLPLVRDEAA